MRRNIIYILFISTCISCIKKENKEILIPVINLQVDDSKYILNSFYPKGDVRRYGVYPNKVISQKNLKKTLLLASKGLPISFPEGYYKTDLVLDGVNNINFIFNNAIINGKVYIIDKDGIKSQKIKFDGTLTILDKLFIRKSNNITFNNVNVISDSINSITHKKNRGVSIYAGSKHIKFDSLYITNTGGTPEDIYKYTAAALQIHGWNNNPENIIINNLKVNNAARTAVYITGKNHKIKNLSIKTFGLGANTNMFGLEDANPNEEKEFTGLWINRCNDCLFEKVIINTNKSKGVYSLKLDEGEDYNPTFINNLQLIEKENALPILDDILTNILVKKVEKH